jgi:hypothetical protein
MNDYATPHKEHHDVLNLGPLDNAASSLTIECTGNQSEQ